MTRLEKKIEKRLNEVRELKRQRRELLLQQHAARIKKRPGRKPTDNALIQRAKLLAIDNPLEFVAFKVGVSRKTLSKYGITRAALDAETN